MRPACSIVILAANLAADIRVSESHAQFCPVSLAAEEDAIRATMPSDALEIERYAGPAANIVVARLNAEPPATDFVADSVLIAYWRGRSGAVVILGIDGCVTGQITLPAARARALFGETL